MALKTCARFVLLPSQRLCAALLRSHLLPSQRFFAALLRSHLSLSRSATEHPKFLHIAGHLSLGDNARQTLAGAAICDLNFLSLARRQCAASSSTLPGRLSKQHPLAIASAAPGLSTTPSLSLS
ncbi:hypothetical protein MRB53_012318 [Persea americana]|uniref:Uncharacterized protein n=1 Tax=Persea americana TaxID=3435 RepID=A0ACC2LWZ9_PERAE|nr:hypothetical protein MRB53_012318 [Persea americana]